MSWSQILFAPIQIFVAHPYVAFLVAAVFLAFAAARKPRGWTIGAAVAWTLYGFEELSAHGQHANIRVDLLVIYPVLIFISTIALWKIWLGKEAPRAVVPGLPRSPERLAIILFPLVAAVYVPRLVLVTWLVYRQSMWSSLLMLPIPQVSKLLFVFDSMSYIMLAGILAFTCQGVSTRALKRVLIVGMLVALAIEVPCEWLLSDDPAGQWPQVFSQLHFAGPILVAGVTTAYRFFGGTQDPQASVF